MEQGAENCGRANMRRMENETETASQTAHTASQSQARSNRGRQTRKGWKMKLKVVKGVVEETLEEGCNSKIKRLKAQVVDMQKDLIKGQGWWGLEYWLMMMVVLLLILGCQIEGSLTLVEELL
ncbi:uncharacterized protein LOC132037819 [Lycium ferocissimum]|uniref:uncharacterized protein LOC132037819 n=1 Tax=Lycium ferocissimum TaxID=112874 RepID=UPI002815E3B9|nr:uncharacterized protein LOC132037819 [Lycium ferocissimum]